jgi:hypothetical protein
MRRLDWDAMRRICSGALDDLTPIQARRADEELGWLGRWWLKPEVLRLAATGRGYPEHGERWARHPDLPAGPGACWVIFASEQAATLPLLREAVLLPLRWERGLRHDARVPEAIRAEANRVLAAVLPLVASEVSWGLRFGVDNRDGLDLSGLHFPAESAWAALAAGLLLALEEGTPHPGVWATGTWLAPGGIGRIDFLDRKLRLAVASGAEAVFLPESQTAEAEKIIKVMADEFQSNPARLAELRRCVPPRARMEGVPRLAIGRLRQGTSRPHAALDEYLARLFQRPLLTDPPATRRAWYCSLWERGQQEAARTWFVDALLNEIAAECRQHLLEWCPDERPSALVTIASDSWELMPQISEIVRPDRCLVLYTAEKAQQYTRALEVARRLVTERGAKCEFVPGIFDATGDFFEQFGPMIRSFANGMDPAWLALDLTPGSKEMSLALQFAAPDRENKLLYLRHKKQGSLVVPGSQQLLVRAAGGRA